MRLENVTCVLTGAAGGIGSALAKALADAGARLVLSGRRGDTLDALAAELAPGAVLASCAGDLTDVSVQDALCHAAQRSEATILINLCGCNAFGLLQEQSPEDVHRLIATNLTAPIQLTQRLLPQLLRQPEAMIVNVGSTFGALGYPGYTVYSASKFGLRGFSEALARELADGPVDVVYVSPRATRTSMNPAAVSALNAELGNTEDEPEKVADAIVDAMRRRARRTGIGWPEKFFSRLNQIVPVVVDKALSRQLPVIKRFALKRSQ
jgi:short-subunit dehydrogenase